MGKKAKSVKRSHDGGVKERESWQFNKSVIECNRHMLDTGLAADVTFRVSSSTDGKPKVHRFHAHKYALISRSPVFYSMLCGDLAERGDITVTDVEPEAFRQMLSYIYTDEVDLNPDQVMFIIYASNKYLLPGLTTKCTDYLKGYLDTTNTCDILEQSIVFDEKDLQVSCMKFIKNETQAALESESFISVKPDTLSKILDSEVFTITEVDVFEACRKWAQNKCDENQMEATGLNMRKTLGDCVNKFRFTNIEIGEFARVVAHTNILTRDEEVEIFRCIAQKETITMPSAFTGENRFFTPPFKILIDDALIEQPLVSKIVKLNIECDKDIEIKSLIVGKDKRICEYLGPDSPLRYSFQSSNGWLDYITYNNNKIKGCKKASANEETKEWKFVNDDSIIIKAGIGVSLDMVFSSCKRFRSGDARIFAIPKQEAILKNKMIEIKLSTNKKIIPLLGFVYEIG